MESLAGDVFLLGTHSWRIKRVESGRVRVEDAQGAAPSIPFWLGEAPGRSPSYQPKWRKFANEFSPIGKQCQQFLQRECGLDEARRQANSRICSSRRRRLGSIAVRIHSGRRTIFRRRRRHAIGIACSLRLANQSRLGAGAAEALLPHFQFRVASRGDRQRSGAFAERAARLSPRTGF